MLPPSTVLAGVGDLKGQPPARSLVPCIFLAVCAGIYITNLLTGCKRTSAVSVAKQGLSNRVLSLVQATFQFANNQVYSKLDPGSMMGHRNAFTFAHGLLLQGAITPKLWRQLFFGGLSIHVNTKRVHCAKVDAMSA